jgi:hypothetical protein
MAIILIYICLAGIALTLAMMIGFGIKNASSRMAGQSKLGLAAFLLPVVILVIAYLVHGAWDGAGVATALAMTLSGFLALIISGARSLFS